MKTTSTSRRDFLKVAATVSGGLWLGFNWQTADANALPLTALDAAGLADAPHNFNSFISIGTDGLITIFSPNPEVGQGIKTAFPMVVADELDADWARVRVEQAPLDTKRFERQAAGGSQSLRHSWTRLRQAGATARQMLVETAAARWNVPASECTTDKAVVFHKASNRKVSYGELATDAAKRPVPTNVTLKTPKQFTIIGKNMPNVDNKEILTGKPIYGIDFYREGMLFAMVQRPPAFGLKLKSVDAAAAKAMPGVTDIVTLKNGVAVVGKNTWAVKKAREKLKVEWEKINPDAPLDSTEGFDRQFKELLDKPGTVRRKDGDPDAAFASAARIIKAEYQCPMLAHSPLEPMNFFAHVRPDGVELVGSTQTPERARNDVAKLLGVAPETVSVNMTRMGGGFGRRLQADFAVEAAEVSSLVKAPVKVIWTREDDMNGGSYRPACRYRFEAALDKDNNLIGYKLRGVGVNVANSTREDNFPAGAVPNLLIDSHDVKSPVTTWAWRAPITNFLAFAEQAFLDEVAAAAGKDPIQFRLDLFAKAKSSPTGAVKYEVDRMEAVTRLVAEKSNWGKNPSVKQGFSVYFSHNSYVAQVAEVVQKNGKPVLQKIHAAADCGVVVSRSGALQQMKGGVVDGLGHALYGKLTLKDGAAEQRNFDAFRLIRMNEVPDVEVYFVENEKDPSGLGEPALPPTGAAVANAMFKATGTRLYNQPFAEQPGSPWKQNM
ncbi:molybdopterin-dependent oxidoreductase [Rudanella paleaurantiibacter]|uniref:Molybdopterin-dependent oxidoreductase n=1 Tax=Rudanella paleaurantiibacter TaxID=2614655 RepID=A0A7J5TV02_9BACT|nr:xanthine dehydrogenase family protein molybdopterin-binding subunit [Rudanella paleaurantiibacter]KAB7727979.1 molybdopterin-dependent oxidoreductase [Rudanella paleaurantiibacter]